MSCSAEQTRRLTRFLPWWLAALAWGLPLQLSAQAYSPRQAFAPLFYPDNGQAFRSAAGTPGPAYWQNRADYALDLRFDTAAKRLSGTVRITYTNYSPDTLKVLWLQLVPNLDRRGSRASAVNPGIGAGDSGMSIAAVQLRQRGRLRDAAYRIADTRMQITLPEELAPRGGRLELSIRYAYTLPPSGGGGRSGYLDTRGGRIYEVSYAYPRLCVYDDLRGWNTLPFLGGGEFYLDYGDIDYRITLPAGMIVAGSGELQNPGDVLTPLEQRRLAAARASDSTLLIRDPAAGEAATRAAPGGWLTWHFRMEHTRDVAWVASAAYVWDAAGVALPGGRRCLAMSVYPAESRGDSAWGRATEYLSATLRMFSRHWFVYPYPVAVNAAGPVGGMEYPGIVFDHWRARGKSLFMLTAHEFGHNWFPMIVGSDERRFPWMDEGFNTFIDIRAHEEFHGGEYAPKRDGEYAPGGGNPADEMAALMKRPGLPPLMTTADAMADADVHPLAYFKAAFGLVLLREVILGPARFDTAFRQYIQAWAFRHPSPRDFFRAMDNGAGEDLSWFWRGWFFQNWTLDQAVTAVRYAGGNPAGGALVSIRNLGALPMPVLVKVTEEGGNEQRLRLPVEIWQRGDRWTFRVNSHRRILRVELDPERQLPDTDRSNNVWTAGDGQ